MAISKLDFARGQVGNPLDSIGDDLLKFGSSLHQQDKDRLAAERQNELLTMQKQEHQMKVDAVTQAAKEKQAANTYADALGAATSGNVVGLADQKLLGDKVGALGNQAAAAYAGGDKVLGDKLVAEQESYVTSVLPKMTKAYEASPEAQLQVLRGTNPLGGTADLAPQTRIALLKEAEAPMEKKSDRLFQTDLQKEAENRRFANEKILVGVRSAAEMANQEALLKAKDAYTTYTGTTADGKMATFTGKELREAPAGKYSNVMPLDDTIKLKTATTVKESKYDVFKDENDNLHYLKEGETNIPSGWSFVGNKTSGSGSAGGTSKSKGFTSVLDTLGKNANEWDKVGSGDRTEAENVASMALALGVDAGVVDYKLQSALSSGKGLLTDTKFPPSVFSGMKVKTADGKYADAGDVITSLIESGQKPVLTDKGFKLEPVVLKDAAGNKVDTPTVLPKQNANETAAKVLPKTGLEMGPTLEDKVLGGYDAVVNKYKGAFDTTLPNKALAKQELGEVRNLLGPTVFEQRYPGLAQRYNLY